MSTWIIITSIVIFIMVIIVICCTKDEKPDNPWHPNNRGYMDEGILHAPERHDEIMDLLRKESANDKLDKKEVQQLET